jgi:hypothetical protein
MQHLFRHYTCFVIEFCNSEHVKKLILQADPPIVVWLALGAATLLFTLLLYSQTFRDTVESAVLWAKEMMSPNPVLGAVGRMRSR